MNASAQALQNNYTSSVGVRSGNLLFICGQVGRGPDLVIPKDGGKQTEIALLRTQEILRVAGLDLSDLVEVVSYHVGMDEFMDDFLAVKAKMVPAPYPAWSTIGVSSLATPEMKIEIRSVAAFRS
jgi:enamine deaminase RidA (YjgF/YER057c/UK114 family)